MEWGLFDLELARPVPRRDVVTRSLIVSLGVTAVVGCAMMAGTFAGLAALAPAGSAWPRFPRVLGLAAHLVALSWVFASAGLLASALARRSGAAFGGVAVIVVCLYLLNFIADSWEKAAPLRPYLPFHYFPGFEVASGTALDGAGPGRPRRCRGSAGGCGILAVREEGSVAGSRPSPCGRITRSRRPTGAGLKPCAIWRMCTNSR